MSAISGHDVLHLQSEVMAARWLRDLHPGAEQSSLYQSAEKVAASARQAMHFQTSADLVEMSVQPLLRYYALLHWMKTVLYLLDLSYPPSSSVLQHGLSLRRSKRSAYHWPLEAVHVYKEGVLQSFCDLFELTHILPTRFIVGDVLGSLPGTCLTIGQVYPHFQHVYPIQHPSEGVAFDDKCGYVSRRIASNLGLTIDEWLSTFQCAQCRLNHQAGATYDLCDRDGLLLISTNETHPWLSQFKGTTYVDERPPSPAWMLHFIILYSLSSLCRYNPLEWSEVLTWSNERDALLIREYLHLYPMNELCTSVLTVIQRNE